jgi:GNAT superfamily N-acetyltransferase
MVIIRNIRFNEWITPLKLSAQILTHIPQPQKTLLQLKLPISLLVMKLYHMETIYVAEQEDQIIGICIAQIQKNTLIIEGTAIHSDHRRKGLSTQLKKAVEETAKKHGATKAITKIEPTNKPAIKMAQTQGYQATEKEKIYEKKLD